MRSGELQSHFSAQEESSTAQPTLPVLRIGKGLCWHLWQGCSQVLTEQKALLETPCANPVPRAALAALPLLRPPPRDSLQAARL